MRHIYTKNKVLPSKLTLDFLTFHRDNPRVYELFTKFATAVARNRSKFGARAILERIRWETNVETNGATVKNPERPLPPTTRGCLKSTTHATTGCFNTTSRQQTNYTTSR